MYNEDKPNLIQRMIGPKREWRQYKARVRKLPPTYRDAVAAVERYVMHFGPHTGEGIVALFTDVLDLFEQAAADGTPVRAIVGEDPVEFADALIANYDKGGYIAREQDRLKRAIDKAAGGEARGDEASS